MTYQDLPDTKRFPAILRDADSQLLSTGEVLVRACEHRGVFWPKGGASLSIPQGFSAIFETHLGVQIRASKILRCPDPTDVHYHFEIDPLA